MAITGYTNKISVEPDSTIEFMVNCDKYDNYNVEIVQLIHGDTNPEGPGLKQKTIDTSINGIYAGREQKIYCGSFVEIPNHPFFEDITEFSLQALIWPSTIDKPNQGIMTKWSSSMNAGYGLFIDEKGCLSLWLGDGKGNVEKISTGKPLIAQCWYFVGASYDQRTGHVSVFQKPIIKNSNSHSQISSLHSEKFTGEVEVSVSIVPKFDNDVPLLIAGCYEDSLRGRTIASGLYNGKIDRPRFSQKSLTQHEMALLIENPSNDHSIVAWDFSKGITSKGYTSPSKIYDISPNQLNGKAINLPTRAVTGYNWTSEEVNFVHAPEQYGAIHFHDDDLEDAEWEVDFTFQVPKNLSSGVYAAHLTADEDEDYIPFIVRPKLGEATADMALLIPTASYLAYANSRIGSDAPLAQLMVARAPVIEHTDMFLREHIEYGLSTYDTHSDGSGNCYSTRLRPILNMRPKFRHNLSPSLWQFNADLHLVDWLTEMGYKFDVITDEDLHLEGSKLLDSYNVVMTGSHPEYYSGKMLDSVLEYQNNGGRFMYMGANGFYWITSYHPENPAIIEVRKNYGSNAWKTYPGELHLSFTGEQGGLWRHRGRAPQKIGGTGFIAEGFDISSYYKRQPDSFDPGASWIFEGVGKEERIGDFGLVGGGAAGLELDIYDQELGSPSHAYLLASSENHTDVYLQVVEELYFNVPGMGGTENPNVRADMVYYKTPNEGAVFSVSSIAYSGSLSHNNYDNNVSKITANVLNKFMSAEKLPGDKIEFAKST